MFDMKNVVKITSAFVAALLFFSIFAWTFHSKAAYHKMNEFYKYPEDYDVWFFGSSHVIMGTLPQELYKEYNIRSYNFAEYGQSFAIDYWVTKNLFKITKPKLIVLDAAQVMTEEKYSKSNLGGVRRMISSLPLGKDKIDAINDLFDAEEDKDLRTELLFPFAADHYNWEYLTKDYFELEESYELGSDQNVFGGRGKSNYNLVTPTTIPDPISIDDAIMTETVGTEYLRKLLMLCKENQVEVLMVKCPLNTDVSRLKYYNKAFLIAQEFEVPYINGFELKSQFDGDTDMWDVSHLNSLGARKWTHILGEYLSENYSYLRASSINALQKQRWDDRYENYQNFLDSELPLQTYFYSYLMLCTHPRYDLDVTIKKIAKS